ncbi:MULTISPECIES: hypothetical protein [Bacteroidales]|uniref:hypothetical protein n=1 Tax=Bacteroidales TaxID=171549 RepID=UPI0025B6FE54|nr:MULTISPECIES: hypothetical protein [Bacteroidales]
MEKWMEILTVLLGGGGIAYLLVDRFARTREQRGADSADMISKVSEAFDKTLQTSMRYSQEVIEKMRSDDERSEARYRELEARYAKLEQRFEEQETDLALLKSVVGKAVTCKYLKTARNEDCPVIRENQKRLTAKCRACKTDEKTNKNNK